MSDAEDKSQKAYDATEQKLSDLRKKGEIPRSSDFNAAISLTILTLTCAAVGGWALNKSASILQFLLGAAGHQVIAEKVYSSPDAILAAIYQVTLPLFGILLLSSASVILWLAATKGIVFAPEKLSPRLSRISIVKSAQSKFGPSGLFEFLKSFAKLLIYSLVLGIALSAWLPELLRSIYLGTGQIVNLMLGSSLNLMLIASFITVTLGVVDFIWQRHHFLNSHRMSREDMKDELRKSEGDPEQKAKRKRRAFDIAQNRMMLDVPKADVVIVNPTHYAIALRWDRQKKGTAPKCVAKGQDHLAAAIREVASRHGVPIFSDPPTARELHATVEIGQQVRFEHYESVAAAIRYADRLNKKAKRQ